MLVDRMGRYLDQKWFFWLTDMSLITYVALWIPYGMLCSLYHQTDSSVASSAPPHPHILDLK